MPRPSALCAPCGPSPHWPVAWRACARGALRAAPASRATGPHHPGGAQGLGSRAADTCRRPGMGTRKICATPATPPQEQQRGHAPVRRHPLGPPGARVRERCTAHLESLRPAPQSPLALRASGHCDAQKPHVPVFQYPSCLPRYRFRQEAVIARGSDEYPGVARPEPGGENRADLLLIGPIQGEGRRILREPGGRDRINVRYVATSLLWWQAGVGRRGAQSRHAWRRHSRRVAIQGLTALKL